MFFRRFTDEKLAQYSYLIGCQKTGEAIVIDPPRKVDHIIAAAEQEGLDVVAAADTHIHADYVSGARQLGVEYGAKLYLSDEGDANWKYEFPEGVDIELVKDGDEFSVGNVDFKVVHTPGHTPEHISFILTDRGGGATEPLGIFTGDFVFVGDIGRPDLLEEAAGMIGTAKSGAYEMFKSIQKFKELPDYMMVWPAHGAGSACGKSLGAVPSSTVGYEKQFNWAMKIDDEETFVEELLKDQPEAPVYFAEMKRVNKIGPAVIKNEEPNIITDVNEFQKLREENDVLILDTRMPLQAQKDLVKGSINIPFNKAFTNWAGWIAKYDERLVIIAEEQNFEEITIALQSIGFDNIYGFTAPETIASVDKVTYNTIELDQFIEEMETGDAYVIDVRNLSEWNEGHFEQANHHFIGYFRHVELPENVKKVMVYCETGIRSAIAASILKSRGYEEVKHMTSGYQEAVLLNKITV
jgi:hydroxyacylglutathione hydrolase